jgi:hypothetical protein
LTAFLNIDLKPHPRSPSSLRFPKSVLPVSMLVVCQFDDGLSKKAFYSNEWPSR